MRIQWVLLLTLAAVFAGNASARTTKARSIVVNQDHAPAKRLLRFDATADVGDDEEERAAWYESVTKLFKANTAPKVLSKLERDNPELAKLVKKDSTGAFKSLELAKFKSVDDLFTSMKYELWLSHMFYRNSQSKYKPFSVAKFFSSKYGNKKAFKMFVTAAESSNSKVQVMGRAYEVQLFKQFQKAGYTHKQISKNLGGDEAAAKMFATVIGSSGKADSNLGKTFRNDMLIQWALNGKKYDEVTKIAPTFANAYASVLSSMTSARGNNAAVAAMKRAVASV